MTQERIRIEDEKVKELLDIEESYFVDLKGKGISPAKFTKTVSAFANASGGEIFVGIEEEIGTDGKTRPCGRITASSILRIHTAKLM